VEVEQKIKVTSLESRDSDDKTVHFTFSIVRLCNQ